MSGAFVKAVDRFATLLGCEPNLVLGGGTMHNTSTSDWFRAVDVRDKRWIEAETHLRALRRECTVIVTALSACICKVL